MKFYRSAAHSTHTFPCSRFSCLASLLAVVCALISSYSVCDRLLIRNIVILCFTTNYPEKAPIDYTTGKAIPAAEGLPYVKHERHRTMAENNGTGKATHNTTEIVCDAVTTIEMHCNRSITAADDVLQVHYTNDWHSNLSPCHSCSSDSNCSCPECVCGTGSVRSTSSDNHCDERQYDSSQNTNSQQWASESSDGQCTRKQCASQPYAGTNDNSVSHTYATAHSQHIGANGTALHCEQQTHHHQQQRPSQQHQHHKQRNSADTDSSGSACANTTLVTFTHTLEPCPAETDSSIRPKTRQDAQRTAVEPSVDNIRRQRLPNRLAASGKSSAASDIDGKPTPRPAPFAQSSFIEPHRTVDGIHIVDSVRLQAEWDADTNNNPVQYKDGEQKTKALNQQPLDSHRSNNNNNNDHIDDDDDDDDFDVASDKTIKTFIDFRSVNGEQAHCQRLNVEISERIVSNASDLSVDKAAREKSSPSVDFSTASSTAIPFRLCVAAEAAASAAAAATTTQVQVIEHEVDARSENIVRTKICLRRSPINASFTKKSVYRKWSKCRGAQNKCELGRTSRASCGLRGHRENPPAQRKHLARLSGAGQRNAYAAQANSRGTERGGRGRRGVGKRCNCKWQWECCRDHLDLCEPTINRLTSPKRGSNKAIQSKRNANQPISTSGGHRAQLAKRDGCAVNSKFQDSCSGGAAGVVKHKSENDAIDSLTDSVETNGNGNDNSNHHHGKDQSSATITVTGVASDADSSVAADADEAKSLEATVSIECIRKVLEAVKQSSASERRSIHTSPSAHYPANSLKKSVKLSESCDSIFTHSRSTLPTSLSLLSLNGIETFEASNRLRRLEERFKDFASLTKKGRCWSTATIEPSDSHSESLAKLKCSLSADALNADNCGHLKKLEDNSVGGGARFSDGNNNHIGEKVSANESEEIKHICCSHTLKKRQLSAKSDEHIDECAIDGVKIQRKSPIGLCETQREQIVDDDSSASASNSLKTDFGESCSRNDRTLNRSRVASSESTTPNGEHIGKSPEQTQSIAANSIDINGNDEDGDVNTTASSVHIEIATNKASSSEDDAIRQLNDIAARLINCTPVSISTESEEISNLFPDNSSEHSDSIFAYGDENELTKCVFDVRQLSENSRAPQFDRIFECYDELDDDFDGSEDFDLSHSKGELRQLLGAFTFFFLRRAHLWAAQFMFIWKTNVISLSRFI